MELNVNVNVIRQTENVDSISQVRRRPADCHVTNVTEPSTTLSRDPHVHRPLVEINVCVCVYVYIYIYIYI